MAFIRTILAALIAASIAVLPAAGEGMASPSATQAMMVDQAGTPCCPCCNTQDDFKLPSCVLKCITLVGAVFPTMAVTPTYSANGAPLHLADVPFREFLRAPPTHPPSR